MSYDFINALKNKEYEIIKKIPKSDLHNHCILGGNREQIKKAFGVQIDPILHIMSSMNDMHKWYESSIGSKFDSPTMRIKLVESTVYQAKQDGVKILEIGEDFLSLNHYYGGNIEELINVFKNAIEKYGQGIELRLQIGLSRHCCINDLEKWLEPFWDHPSFYSIDLYGDELCQPIENFVPIYKKAGKFGLRRKAHVGEWGSAEDVRSAIELLELDEIQHGIAAANSKEVMNYLQQNKIRLNLTPTSNIKLGRVTGYETHPIKDFYYRGIDVTINSDDVLIFDSDVSKEYIRLYEHGVFSAEDLNEIRLNGLKDI